MKVRCPINGIGEAIMLSPYNSHALVRFENRINVNGELVPNEDGLVFWRALNPDYISIVKEKKTD